MLTVGFMSENFLVAPLQLRCVGRGIVMFGGHDGPSVGFRIVAF